MKNIKTVLPGIFALGMLVAGASQAVNYSGFLNDYPMQPDPDRAGMMMYNKPDIDLADYDKIMIAPITIFVHPDDSG